MKYSSKYYILTLMNVYLGKNLKVKTETNECLTKGILTSCKEKNRLYKIYKCNPTIENEQTYKIK